MSSQADTQNADLKRERMELENHSELELEELAAIYLRRGLPRDVAHSVAIHLAEKERQLGSAAPTALRRPGGCLRGARLPWH